MNKRLRILKRYRDWRIERKLSWISMLTNAVALTAVSVLLILQYARAAERQTREDLFMLAQVVGNNAQAALSFMDVMDAEEILQALRHKDNIVAAQLFDAQGEPFASFARPGVTPPERPEPLNLDAVEEWEEGLLVYVPVIMHDELIGGLAMKADLSELREAMQLNVQLAAGLTGAAILMALLLAGRLQRIIVRQINRMVEMANRVAEGALPEDLPGLAGDEIGDLERAFNRMGQANRGIVHSAQQLAKGDYAIDLKPRSEQDELTLSLIRMTEALVRFNEENRRQGWLKGGLSELSDRMRGAAELQPLCDGVVRFVAEYVEAPVGLFFLRDAEAERLEVVAGFGFRPETSRPVVAHWGEGPVGEAAARKATFRIENIGESPLRIDMGFCQVVPRHLFVQPLICEDAVIGALELAMLKPLSEWAEDFMAQAAGPIAITLRAMQARMRELELQRKTRLQADELLRSQEELRQTNVELEERAELFERQRKG